MENNELIEKHKKMLIQHLDDEIEKFAFKNYKQKVESVDFFDDNLFCAKYVMLIDDNELQLIRSFISCNASGIPMKPQVSIDLQITLEDFFKKNFENDENYPDLYKNMNCDFDIEEYLMHLPNKIEILWNYTEELQNVIFLGRTLDQYSEIIFAKANVDFEHKVKLDVLYKENSLNLLPNKAFKR